MHTFEPGLHLHTYMHSFEPRLPGLPTYMQPEGEWPPNDTSPLVTAAPTSWELVEAGPKCSACTPVWKLFGSQQKWPEAACLHTLQQPCPTRPEVGCLHTLVGFVSSEKPVRQALQSAPLPHPI